MQTTTAPLEPSAQDRWRLDRWSEAAAKAIFRDLRHFSSPPADLTGLKRLPGALGESGFIAFRSEKLRRWVACESGLELKVFSWLERSPEVRWYQEQPTAVPCVLDAQPGLYYPDVAVWDRAGRMVVVEVKPTFMMYRADTLAKAIAALDHFGPRGIGYLLVDRAGRTLADFARVAYDRELVMTVEELFAHGPVSFRLVRNFLRMRHGQFDAALFASMAVNRDWAVTNGPPVRIWRLPGSLTFQPLRGMPIAEAETIRGFAGANP